VTLVGAALAAVATSALLLAVRSPTQVGRRLDLIAPTRARPRWQPIADRDLRHALVTVGAGDLLAMKAAACLGGVLLAATASLFASIGPALIPVAGYAGWVAPSVVIGGRATRRRAEAERGSVVLIERLEALMAAGRPAETALGLLIGRPTGSVLLDATLRRVSEAYLLGAPLFRTLADRAREEGFAICAGIAEDLERARDLATGSLAIVRERRVAVRAAERARSLEAAAQVEGKLMLVLVLCYLPALMLLVVIPLFLALVEGLFA
jgi:hypothetical protein